MLKRTFQRSSLVFLWRIYPIYHSFVRKAWKTVKIENPENKKKKISNISIDLKLWTWHGLHQRGGWLTASGVFQLSAPAFKIAASNGTGPWIRPPCFPCPYVLRWPRPHQPRTWPQKCPNTSSRPKRGSCLTSSRGHSTRRRKSSFASWCVWSL